MARKGRPRQNPPTTSLDLLEAFCCAQVERVQRTLARVYGYEGDPNGYTGPGAHSTGPKNYLMPQNDHFTRIRLLRDTTVDIRGRCGRSSAWQDRQEQENLRIQGGR